jgi:hypothetical protein
MSDRTSNLIGGISGLVSVLLFVVGLGVLAGTTPKLGASSDAVTTYVGRSNVETWTGAYLGLAGLLVYVVFASRLWAILRRAEGDSAWLSAMALGAALVGVAVTLSADFTSGAAAFYAGRRGLDPATVGVLYDLKHFAELVFGAINAVFFAAVAVLVLGRRALPRWLGWVAAVVVLGTLATIPFGPGDISELPHFLAVLWLVAVSVLLIARRSTLRGAKAQSP